ncbi:MAG: tyrosine-type recombinase/integrase [Caldilinea sp.]|nr:tyrosine-type recombinase/integrase [Caldilinea sp.]MCB0146277.1 tyrosine-type recombinase/integrase [Caldilineaceae bacterium]MCO5210858.1 tyrosine-type recombinase/integrase [Caldilinea sp.]MCW5842706.1 tyrosine-type recombinase/integrase [Caldilinea sp.]
MTTIDEALQVLIIDAKARQCTPPTIAHYRGRITDFARWLANQDGAIHTVDGITHHHIRQYLAHLIDRGLASATVHTHGRAVRAFLNFCQREGIVQESAFARVRIGRPDRIEKLPLDRADIDRLLAASDSARDTAIVLTLLDTGIRASECTALNVGDIGRQCLHIRKGKGRKARTVPFGQRTAAAIAEYIAERGELPPKTPLFASNTNRNLDGRLTASGLRRVIVLLADAAGVVGVHPHRFRRTFAVWSLRNGMSIYHLQRIMGHEDLDTLRGYLSLVDNDLREAHARFGPVDAMQSDP